MFTLNQINDIHRRLGSQNTLLQYLHALNDIGVIKSDSFLTDGHTAYYSDAGHIVMASGVHEAFRVSDIADTKLMQKQLKLHEYGKTSYLEMSQGLADAGVEKWTFDTAQPSITYYDKLGNVLLTEPIN